MLKTSHKESKVGFFLWTFNMKDSTLSPQWTIAGDTRVVSLGVFDFRDTTYGLYKGDDYAKYFVHDLMEKVICLSNPSYNDPTISF